MIRDGQGSFAGGLNTVSDDIALQPNQVRLAQNARLTEYGALVKRYGSVTLATANLGAAVRGGYSWNRDNGDVQGLAVAGNTLYTINMLSNIGTQAWTARTTVALSTTVTPVFAEFVNHTGADAVFIADGGKLVYWDGTTMVRETSGAAHTATFITVHNQRIWGCGDSTYPDSIFYSKLNDGSSFGHAGGGQIVVRTFADEKIIGLASVGSSLLIFHRRGISRLTGFGQDDTTVQPEGVSSQTGTIAPLSIVEADGVAYFLSDRGAFVASESSVAPLGTPTAPDPILPLLQNLSTTTLANVRGVLSRRTQEIWWFIPGYGVYVYHLILRAWAGPWIGEYLTTASLWPSLAGASAETYVIRGDTSGQVTVSDYVGAHSDGATTTSLDSGTPILMSVQLRRLYFGDDSVAKSFRFGYLTAIVPGGSTVTVDWTSNFGSYPQKSITAASGGGVWDEPGAVWDVPGDIWGTAGGSQNYRIQMSGQGYYVDVTLGHSGYNEPIISRWSIDGVPLGRR